MPDSFESVFESPVDVDEDEDVELELEDDEDSEAAMDESRCCANDFEPYSSFGSTAIALL